MKRVLLSLLFLCSVAIAVNAQNIAAEFSSTTQGTLDGIPFTISDWPSSGFTAQLDVTDYTSLNSYCAPLGAAEDNITHPSGLGWTVTFDQPVENLRVYLSCFRSTSNGTFNATATKLSGSIGLAMDGVTVTGGSCSYGLLEFAGPLTTLTFTPNTLGSGSFQNFTFGLGDGTDCGSEGGFIDPCEITFNDPGTVTLENGQVTGQGFATPSGGVYSGAGVTDNGNGFTFTFDPNVTGLGAQEVTYTYEEKGEWSLVPGSALMVNANQSAFGRRVAITPDGSRAVISAPTNADDGAVRVYDWDGSNWTQVGQTLTDNVTAFPSFYGFGVDISHDGSRIAVSYSSFRVEVYDFDGTNWVLVGAALEGNGRNVRLNADGSRLLIGDSNTNRNVAIVYDWDGTNWTQVGSTLEEERDNDRFGGGIDISDDGSIIVVGASENNSSLPVPRLGYVKVFQYDEGTMDWVQLGSKIEGKVDQDWLGGDVSISADGMRFVTNATGGSTWVGRAYEYNGSDWMQIGEDIDGERNMRSGSMTPDGNKVVFETSGSFYVFEWDGTEWVCIGERGVPGFNIAESGSIWLAEDGNVYAGGSNNVGIFKVSAACSSSATANILVISNSPANVSTESGNRITFGDPCFCNNPLNCLQDNDVLLFHDVLRIPESGTIASGLEIRIESSSNFFIDVPCEGGMLTEPSYGAISGTIIPETSPGVYEIDFWRPSGVQPTLSVTESNNVTMAPAETFQPLCFQEDCPDCAISNVAVQSDDTCDGADATFTLSFDVTDGSGNYQVVAAETNADLGVTMGDVLGTLSGATDGMDLQIMGTIATTTAATALLVQVEDADEDGCALDTAVSVNIPACVIPDDLPALPRGLLIGLFLVVLGAGVVMMKRF
ncbi:MAG TPA: hypothetical protein VJ953_00730 [Saprospiraceae bacterium]|nr:hypothetical protein [Saprospiraceae bacterium]